MANNTIITMDSLKEKSIQVYSGMIVVDPYFQKESAINISKLVPKFNGCYTSYDSVTCFVSDNKVFVTPFTSMARDCLRSAGFRQEHFYMPFSRWDYPKKEQVEWETLFQEARDEEDFLEATLDILCGHWGGSRN